MGNPVLFNGEDARPTAESEAAYPGHGNDATRASSFIDFFVRFFCVGHCGRSVVLAVTKLLKPNWRYFRGMFFDSLRGQKSGLTAFYLSSSSYCLTNSFLMHFEGRGLGSRGA